MMKGNEQSRELGVGWDGMGEGMRAETKCMRSLKGEEKVRRQEVREGESHIKTSASWML